MTRIVEVEVEQKNPQSKQQDKKRKKNPKQSKTQEDLPVPVLPDIPEETDSKETRTDAKEEEQCPPKQEEKVEPQQSLTEKEALEKVRYLEETIANLQKKPKVVKKKKKRARVVEPEPLKFVPAVHRTPDLKVEAEDIIYKMIFGSKRK